MNATEREALRESARLARSRARELAARALMLRAELGVAALTAQARVAVAKEVRDSLRRSVFTYAHILRQLDESPEVTVIMVKSIATDASEDVDAGSRTIARERMRSVRDDLVRWAIDAYYGIAS
jgi:hypothetical protein